MLGTHSWITIKIDIQILLRESYDWIVKCDSGGNAETAANGREQHNLHKHN